MLDNIKVLQLYYFVEFPILLGPDDIRNTWIGMVSRILVIVVPLTLFVAFLILQVRHKNAATIVFAVPSNWFFFLPRNLRVTANKEVRQFLIRDLALALELRRVRVLGLCPVDNVSEYVLSSCFPSVMSVYSVQRLY